jgi:nicotine blue oxidoreductase
VVAGVLLAAGAGRRYGMPKALVSEGEWLRRAVGALVEGGCDPAVVVLGAAADRAVPLVPVGARVVVALDWDEGMGASLRAGLAALGREVDAALVHLVDLPDLGGDVVRRVVALAGPGVVARAQFAGRPGHPVLLGRDHWDAVAAVASGDRGARDWLAGRSDLVLVDCTDLATGADVDRP